MIKREFEVQIIESFKTHWIAETAKHEHITPEEAELFYGGDELNVLHARISGQRVTMTENEYPVGDNDFFEKIDNNFVMHRKLFAEI